MESQHNIQQILERYPYFESHGMKPYADFVSTLLRLFEDDPCFPEQELNQFPLHTTLDYIRRTHNYYLTKKLPEIEQSIETLLMDYSEGKPLLIILRKLYFGYKNELTNHIQDEERYLLPHIDLLLKGSEGAPNIAAIVLHLKRYSLSAFISLHSDTQDDLRLMDEIIELYHPQCTNQTPYRVLLTQLRLFEKDLAVHAIIEDRILIPRAIGLEMDLMTEAKLHASQN
jgi:regulator of cell morphogenesis and NO signaling